MSTIFQITTGQILFGSSVIAVLWGGIQWLLANWIKTRLEQSIRHEYDKKIEDYKFLQLQRQKAEAVAIFFAKWIKYRGTEKKLLDKTELINYYEELNKMSLELSLWIKDNKLLNKIQDRLQMKADAEDIRSITTQVRKYILNLKKDDFNPGQITLWPTKEETKKLFEI